MLQTELRDQALTAGDLTLRISRYFGALMLGVLPAGCYTLQPAGGITPELGTTAAFDINDVGRVALGGSMGPEIDQVEGRVLSKEGDGSDFVLAVSAVRLLKGGEVAWRGEQIHLKHEYFSTVYLRKYSPGRTIALSAVGIGLVAALASTQLLGTGSEDPPTPKPDTGLSRKIPLPKSLPPRITLDHFPPLTTP